jgi:hypothetical protein
LTGKKPAKVQVSNRRVFQHADIVRIANHFGIAYPPVDPAATPAA